MNKRDVRVGQTVILEPYGNEARYTKEPQEATIVKIDRTYFYVERIKGQPIAFKIETGQQKDFGFGYGRDWTLFLTWQDYHDKQEYVALRNRMREVFNSYPSPSKNNIPLDKLRRIAAILDEPPERQKEDER